MRLIEDGASRLLEWRERLPPVAARVATVRARRPFQEEKNKGPRHGARHASKLRKEGAAPKAFKRVRCDVPSNSMTTTSSNDDSQSESQSDIAASGFHYSDAYSNEDSSSYS